MRVTVFGGVGEVGGNKILVEESGTRVFLDFGMSFSKHGQFFDEYLKPRPILRDLLRLGLVPALDGIYREDLIRPDNWKEALADGPASDPYWNAPVLSGAEWRQSNPNAAKPAGVDAVVLTHAHLDHVGHISYLDPHIPVFCSPITKTIVKAVSDVSKSSVDGQFYEGTIRGFQRSKPDSKQATFPGTWGLRKNGPTFTRPYEAKSELVPFTIGSLTFTLVPVDHSVPGACAVHVRSQAGKTLLYTGDVRFHGRLADRQAALRKFAEASRPDLLLCEGTRIVETSGDTEDGVEKRVKEEVEATDKLAMVEFGWKDTTRFDTLQRVAEATGRTLVVSPKLAYLLRTLRNDLGAPFRGVRDYANVRTYLDRRESLLYSKSDYAKEKYTAGEAANWDDRYEPEWTPGEKEIFLAHWNHGARAPEIRAHPERFVVSLSFFDMNDLHDLEPPRGSLYLRCQCEPFSDEMRLDTMKQRNWFEVFQVNESRGNEVLQAHASGHAAGTDLKPFAKAIEARRLLPIHTTHPEEFAGLAPDIVAWGKPSEPVVVTL